jgi:biotin carboxylase
MPEVSQLSKQIILLTTPQTYRAEAFLEAGDRLGIEVVQAIDLPQALAEEWQTPLGIDFKRPKEAVRTLLEHARAHPVQAILAIDDSGSLVAALASEALSLPYNAGDSAQAARNKYEMRRLFAKASVPSPAFWRYDLSEDPQQIANQLSYPVVLKPLLLSGSRGVIRANDPSEFLEAYARLSQILHSSGTDPDSHRYLVEEYIPGIEVALEGLLTNGQLKVLALFDKPDPLHGPFFEETIYVTPSRLPEGIHDQIACCAEKAAAALGLTVGPVHAELRINERGPWLVELAARSIGGYCSKALRFDMGVSLEELILRQAAGLDIEGVSRDRLASGVMMIPIPKPGILKGVSGVEAALAVPGIDEVQITAKPNSLLVPLPEGASYLGFIFARGDEPGFVETALRQAHRNLEFEIQEILPIFAPPVIAVSPQHS